MPPATWSLPTATSEYVVALAPEGLGLLADRWGAGAGYRPPERIAFETLADVLPLELTAAGTRHVQRADLLVGLAGGRTVALRAGPPVQAGWGIVCLPGDSGCKPIRPGRRGG